MAKILNFFDGCNIQDHPPILSKSGGVNMTRSGMAVSTKQLYNIVMTGKSSTAIIDQPNPYNYDTDDNSFGPDERELATAHQYVQTKELERTNKAKQLLINENSNDHNL